MTAGLQPVRPSSGLKDWPSTLRQPVYRGRNAPIRKVSGGTISTIGNNADGLAVDALGALYIAQATSNQVLRISGGVATTVAGNGTAAYSGDGAQAVNASLNGPTGVVLDAGGNLYIADRGNHRIRRVSSNIITTVAGNGIPGFTGEGGLAINAELDFPAAVALDPAGNLYVADGLTDITQGRNNRVRKVSGGIITTVAGNGSSGSSGDGGPATSAQLRVYSVAVDNSGNLYIADFLNDQIRKVSGGVITTVAGNGTSGYNGDGQAATSAQLSGPRGVAVDAAGNIYIADSGNNRIREVSGGVITTIAGNGRSSSSDGPATTSGVLFPVGVAVDASANVYFVDGSNYVRKVSGGALTTIVNLGELPPLPRAVIPASIATDAAGNVYVADATNDLIRKLSGDTLITLAGTGIGGYSGDGGPATSAMIGSPAGIAVDAAGSIYFTDGGSRIRKISNGSVTTIAGNGIAGFAGDGGPAIASEIAVDSPWGNGGGLAVDASGNIYIADTGNSRVRQLTETASVEIATVPAGLTITADGVSYSAPQSFNWRAGEIHSIGVPSPQVLANGTRSTFAGWSDGLAATHAVIVPLFGATYTATFTTEYLLTTVVQPAGAGSIAVSPFYDGWLLQPRGFCAIDRYRGSRLRLC